MKTEAVLVDSCVWSVAFRRRRHETRDVATVQVLEHLVDKNLASILGAVRQEVLSGFSRPADFARLDLLLHPFPNEPVLDEDYKEAARCYNRCRERGVQGSHIDFLICAVALRLDVAIFTTDGDFTRYQPILGFRLHEAGH